MAPQLRSIGRRRCSTCGCVVCPLLQLLAMMAIRKLMDFVFTRSELYWMDHNLPGDERVRLEDEQAEIQAHPYSQVRPG